MSSVFSLKILIRGFLVSVFCLLVYFLLFSEVSFLGFLPSCWFILVFSLRLQIFFKCLAILCCHFIYKNEGLVGSEGSDEELE